MEDTEKMHETDWDDVPVPPPIPGWKHVDGGDYWETEYPQEQVKKDTQLILAVTESVKKVCVKVLPSKLESFWIQFKNYCRSLYASDEKGI